MSVAVHHGDCREIIPRLGLTVDAVVTDPPYHLSFMAQQWDGGDIAFRPETWAVIGEPLKPGGFLLAFGGTRTWHRIACAIEDAGFVIQDTIAWIYGSGFPKNKALLKPAFEPIILAYKPGGKRTLQVDECRIEAHTRDARSNHSERPDLGAATSYDFGSRYAIGKTDLGRWPANLCHDGSDEVMEAFARFGETSSIGHRHNAASKRRSGMFGVAGDSEFLNGTPADSGTAARFFYCAKADKQDRWGSHHPTVKPVSLVEWLVKLVCPPGGTVLDPFAGSGTTAVAALAAGRDAILIEREDQYVADIRERVAFYEGEGRHSLATKARSREPREALPLFGNPREIL